MTKKNRRFKDKIPPEYTSGHKCLLKISKLFTHYYRPYLQINMGLPIPASTDNNVIAWRGLVENTDLDNCSLVTSRVLWRFIESLNIIWDYDISWPLFPPSERVEKLNLTQDNRNKLFFEHLAPYMDSMYYGHGIPRGSSTLSEENGKGHRGGTVGRETWGETAIWM